MRMRGLLLFFMQKFLGEVLELQGGGYVLRSQQFGLGVLTQNEIPLTQNLWTNIKSCRWLNEIGAGNCTCAVRSFSWRETQNAAYAAK